MFKKSNIDGFIFYVDKVFVQNTDKKFYVFFGFFPSKIETDEDFTINR